jgi:hypothetical protein
MPRPDLRVRSGRSFEVKKVPKSGLMRRSKRRGLSITLRTMLFRAKRPATEVSAAGAPVALASTAA